MDGQAQREICDRLYHEAIALCGQAIARLARSYEADVEKRRDLVQDIHLNLWRSFATFNGQSSLRTWVYRIAHNVAVTHIVRNKRINEKHVSLEDCEALLERDTAQHTGDRHTFDRLVALIRQLSLIDHAVMVLYLEGEDAASISAVTGLTPGNVATKIHRIKNVLARNIGKGADHE